MKTCFIIIPISTPRAFLENYGNDRDHFDHVLNHLFVPAVRKVEMEPIPPIAKGAELIHGEIIKKLETSDLVLCDMSILNPNVFFELGIRTALNKPVCLVKDNTTDRVPFDTNILNHHTYASGLHPWTLEAEVERLAEHIAASLASTPDSNALWSYFSMSLRAEPSEQKGGVEGKVDFLNVQIEALRKQMADLQPAPDSSEEQISQGELVSRAIMKQAGQHAGVGTEWSYSPSGDKMDVAFPTTIPRKVMAAMESVAESLGCRLRIETPNKPDSRRRPKGRS